MELKKNTNKENSTRRKEISNIFSSYQKSEKENGVFMMEVELPKPSDISNNSFSTAFQNKIFFYFILISATILTLLKLPMAQIYYEAVSMALTFAPFIVIVIMSVIAIINIKKHPEYTNIVRKFYLTFTLKFLSAILAFYFLYAPFLFINPILAGLNYLKAVATLEGFFYFLSYLLVIIIALAILFVAFRAYQKSTGKYDGSIQKLTRQTLYVVFFLFLLAGGTSVAAYPQAYKPLTNTLGDTIFTLSVGNIQVFKGDDLSQYKKIKTLGEFASSLSTSLSETGKNISESNQEFKINLDQATNDLQLSISQTQKDLKDKINDDVSGTLSLSGGTIEGNLEIKKLLSAKAGLDMNNNILSNLKDPIELQDAVTKNFLQTTLSSAITSIANGGTGQVTREESFTALAPVQIGNLGKFLQTDGATASWQNILFSDLQNPAKNLSLQMGNFKTNFTFGSSTGSNNLFTIQDGNSNTGTGILLNVTTGDSSLLKPFQVSASQGIFPAISVNNTGLVGIGTENPYSQLTVSGGATFGSAYRTTSLNDGEVAIETSLGIGTDNPNHTLSVGGTFGFSGISASLTGTGLSQTATNQLSFFTNSLARMTIDSNGNVGIGTSTPTAKLEISGIAGTDGIKFPNGFMQVVPADNGTFFSNGGEREGDYYCKKREDTADGQRAAWVNINSTKTCGSGKVCQADGTCGAYACGSTQVQDADGNLYNTVQIGTQCWMASNLNVGTMIGSKLADNTTLQNQTNNGLIEKYCYGYIDADDAAQIATGTANCATDGGLYQWNEMMSYSTNPGIQGICPVDWHLPTDAEQYALENYLKDSGATCNASRVGAWDCTSAGTKLKNGGSSGFKGLLVGGRDTDGSFYYRTSHAYFWSSSESGGDAWTRYLSSGGATVYRYAYTKAYGFSVRCLKN